MATIWEGFPLQETDRMLTVYDNLLASDDALVAGKVIKIEWMAGRWYVTGARCT